MLPCSHTALINYPYLCVHRHSAKYVYIIISMCFEVFQSLRNIHYCVYVFRLVLFVDVWAKSLSKAGPCM